MKILTEIVEPKVTFQPFKIILQFNTLEEAQLFGRELSGIYPKESIPHIESIAKKLWQKINED